MAKASPEVTPRKVEWTPIKEAYIKESPRPTYAELSARFGVPVSTISGCSRDENWMELREANQDATLAKSDAKEVIEKALRSEGPLVRQARDVVRKLLTSLDLILDAVIADQEAKPSTRANVANTVGFALANGAKMMSELGLVSLQKNLDKAKRAGAENGSGWENGMMQQISVTVNGLAAEAKTVIDAKTVDPGPGEATPTNGESW